MRNLKWPRKLSKGQNSFLFTSFLRAWGIWPSSSSLLSLKVWLSLLSRLWFSFSQLSLVSPSLTSRGSDASPLGLPSNFLFLIKAEAVSAAVRFEVARVLLIEDIADLGSLALLSTKKKNNSLVGRGKSELNNERPKRRYLSWVCAPPSGRKNWTRRGQLVTKQQPLAYFRRWSRTSLMNSLRSMSSSSCFKKSREFPVGSVNRGVYFFFQAEQEVNSAFLFLRLPLT